MQNSINVNNFPKQKVFNIDVKTFLCFFSSFFDTRQLPRYYEPIKGYGGTHHEARKFCSWFPGLPAGGGRHHHGVCCRDHGRAQSPSRCRRWKRSADGSLIRTFLFRALAGFFGRLLIISRSVFVRITLSSNFGAINGSISFAVPQRAEPYSTLCRYFFAFLPFR